MVAVLGAIIVVRRRGGAGAALESVVSIQFSLIWEKRR